MLNIIKRFVVDLRTIQLILLLLTRPASASLIAPATVNSNITLQIEYVGTVPGFSNPTSPVSVGSDLLLIDQSGKIVRRNSTGTQSTIFQAADSPAGLTLTGGEKILNAAPNATNDKLIVVFTSSTNPSGLSPYLSPRGNGSGYHVFYSYDYDSVTGLSNPQAIASFEVNTTGHTGGGLVVLADGDILFATGDNGDAGEDGRSFAQDDVSHLGKIISISPDTGEWSIVAKGVRNPQRLVINEHLGQEYLSFVDIGGAVAEELNILALSDVLNASSIENLGWGRNSADNLAREGTFYINSNGSPTGLAPSPEASFIQPLAQWGREDQTFVAGSGPIISSPSFLDIDTLFGDLPSGRIFATRGGLAGINQPVLEVSLVDSGLLPVTLMSLAGGRPDPRFFTFPDASAGVLLESTGDYYSLTQITNTVPEPATFMLASLCALAFAVNSSIKRRA